MKQVLIWRTDLRNTQGQKVRTGKIAAQLAHASLNAILNTSSIKHPTSDVMILPYSEELKEWLNDSFSTKICVGVDSEEELLDIYNKAKNANMYCSLVKDAGLTEFGGVPTYTAVAVGPTKDEDVDKITGKLKLL